LNNLQFDGRGRITPVSQSQRDILRGAAQVPLDVVKLGTNVVQRVANGNKPADPASSPVGRVITAAERGLTQAMQLPQPEQRRPEDLFWQQMGNQFTTGALGAAAGIRLIGANAFTQGAFQSLNPAVQQALRWTAGVGTESFVSTALTDNRQGNPANAFGENAPLAVQPTDDMVSALGKSLLPNAGAEVAFGLAGLGLGKGLNNVTRRVQEGRAVAEVQGARNWAQENGIQVDNDGVHEFTPEAMQPAPAPEAAAPAPKADTTATPAAEPAAAPKAEPINAKQAEEMLLGPQEEGPVHDPSLPEVDTAIQAVDRLDDQRLQEAAASAGPVLPELDRHLGEQQANFQVQEGLNAELLGGPTQNLANPAVPYEAQWQQLPNDTLLSLAAPQNSPRLFEKVQGLTGREFEQFTRGDVIDGLKALREEGYTVLPNRLQDGAVVMDVNAIEVDPARFQFKDNVNAQGQQKGNSLEGVNNWNPDAEGVIQVWTDPADGKTYVVNGHNRLAKAKELGIGSIRTEEILANTPEQARAVGAIANISSGGGTAFDAAKVIRELGITDPAGLEAAGIPLQSGLGVQGLALSKLPDNLFQAAVNGELPMGRALALGGSGLDPEGMTRVVQLAQGRDMTERGFAELTQMASTAPKVESDQMGLFGPEVIDTTIIKAELAARVRAELTSNKNLFKKVGRSKNATKLSEKAGTEVNTTQAQDAAGVAEAVLGEFDQTKYAAETPISQLLNDGAAEIAGGAKPAVIAKRILAQLEKAAEATPPTPKAPVEEPAVDAPVEPGPLLPDQRNELKKAVITRAIQNGEVRPSEAPLPELPDPPRDLSNPELALQDELRLADHYAQQDAIQKQVELEAQRKAIGYDDMPLEEKKANGMLDTWTVQKAGTLDERTQLARQQLEEARAQGDEAGAAAWQQEVRRLERSRLGNAMDAKATTQQDMFGVGQYDTSTPLLNQPPARPQAEIPADAANPITAKTSPGRIEGAAESLMGWANSGLPPEAHLVRSMEQARAIIQAKGAILNTDKVPGLEIDLAWDHRAMGRSTPETQAMAAAYRQFYGLDDSMESAVPGWDQVDAGPAIWTLDDDSPGPFETADAARIRRETRAMAIIHSVTGLDDGLTTRFEDTYRWKITPKEWGGDGIKTSPTGGTYSLMNDTMTIRAVLQNTDRGLDEAAFHESWHRIQYLALSPKEAKVMDTAWARLKTSIGAKHGVGTGIAYSETQAVAFQRYASARLRGEDPIYALLGGYKGDFGKIEKVVNRVAAAFDRVIDFVEKVYNLLANKTFDSTRAIFERGFSGALKGDANFNFQKPRAGIRYMLDPDGWKAQTWGYDPSGANKGVTLDVVMADFDSKLADLKSKALAGGC
jgi:hypothetical protein